MAATMSYALAAIIGLTIVIIAVVFVRRNSGFCLPPQLTNAKLAPVAKSVPASPPKKRKDNECPICGGPGYPATNSSPVQYYACRSNHEHGSWKALNNECPVCGKIGKAVAPKEDFPEDMRQFECTCGERWQAWR